jgi:hypothetical protein
MRKPVKKKRRARVIEAHSGRLWVRLPTSVVEARAGLIPSWETDANPPPEGLTSAELMRWHRGLLVELKIK